MLRHQATDVNRYKSTSLCGNVVVVVVTKMWTHTVDV